MVGCRAGIGRKTQHAADPTSFWKTFERFVLMNEAAALERLETIDQIHLLNAARDRAAHIRRRTRSVFLHALDDQAYNGERTLT